jgi:hypothetical protein
MVRTQEDCTILVWYPPVKDLPGPLVETYNWMAQMSLERQWKDINSDTKDSAFLILPILWWVIYAWCDSIEEIYRYLDWLVRFSHKACQLLIQLMCRRNRCSSPRASGSRNRSI